MTWPRALAVLGTTWPRRGGTWKMSVFDLAPDPRPRRLRIRLGPVPKRHHDLSPDPSPALAAGDPVLAQMTCPRTPGADDLDDLSPWSQTLDRLRD